ncbi:adenosylcobinamide-GDP ribazoletransferase [Crocosphaera sp. UHCC 0190]|uniref:adenosylcobinamide-GDP ribazoletransferase n=1 Tax=Crocosphaera sp. UHCC 0190 TaxID=3110246 RepID=UPI002B1FAF1E|nr:adenosylcobinamide-GDP ribazoletransferase [Crocosphaera sp. UHCC 0190]MEA5509029.1 adenosylcobinamide-GDP ribazoletransferase [Crocosphaera sp. UHCC 0190]
MLKKIQNKFIDSLTSLLGAITFYTILPLPPHWPLKFQRLARWAPLIGLGLGGGLGLGDELLKLIGFPVGIRSALIIVLGIAITGGLHLDGVIDSADGLAVTDRQKRLIVMEDSVTGAFGVMAGVSVIVLKILALGEISDYRWWGLMVAGGWGRWGQVSAIAFYPYLKPTGKGAFHKQQIRLPQDLCWGFLALWGMSGLLAWLNPDLWGLGATMGLMAMAIALGVGAWFNQRLGGHTGDTYGAVVEWTETLILCVLTLVFSE